MYFFFFLQYLKLSFSLSNPPFLSGFYGTIELSVVFDEANELLVVNVLKAKVDLANKQQK